VHPVLFGRQSYEDMAVNAAYTAIQNLHRYCSHRHSQKSPEQCVSPAVDALILWHNRTAKSSAAHITTSLESLSSSSNSSSTWSTTSTIFPPVICNGKAFAFLMFWIRAFSPRQQSKRNAREQDPGDQAKLQDVGDTLSGGVWCCYSEGLRNSDSDQLTRSKVGYTIST
jgi:hypothetical protein